MITTKQVKKLIRQTAVLLIAIATPANATDYLQCSAMEQKIIMLDVVELENAEIEFQSFVWKTQVGENCGGVYWDKDKETYPEFDKKRDICLNSWINSKYKLQGTSTRGMKIYNPASKNLLSRIRKIRQDFKKEGCV